MRKRATDVLYLGLALDRHPRLSRDPSKTLLPIPKGVKNAVKVHLISIAISQGVVGEPARPPLPRQVRDVPTITGVARAAHPRIETMTDTVSVGDSLSQASRGSSVLDD